jgi:Undecaprenyl-phosphate glucose phosphotransferase
MSDGIAVGGVDRRVSLNICYSAAIVGGVTLILDVAIVACVALALGGRLGPSHPALQPPYPVTLLLAGLASLALFKQFRLYAADGMLRMPVQVLRIGASVLIASLLLAEWLYLSNRMILDSLTVAGYFFAVTSVALAAARIAMESGLRTMARRGLLSRNVIVVGTGEQAVRLIESLTRRRAPWTRVLGAFDDRGARAPGSVAGVPVLGSTADLVALNRSQRIDDVYVALPWGAEERILQVLDRIREIPANIHLSPDIVGYRFIEQRQSTVAGVPALKVMPRPIEGWNAVLKWVEDKVIASLALLALSPLFVAVAIAIKLDSPGPVFFRQKRYGLNNALIEVFKFRSMYHNLSDLHAERLTSRGDSRVTRVGRFLRRTSIDELPQFINVLLGDMSVVGPRPHATRAKAAGRLYQDVVTDYAVRHKVKPGITGLAQVNGWRGETDTEEKIVRRVEFDLKYLENWSLFLDLTIIFQSFLVFFAGEDVY